MTIRQDRLNRTAAHILRYLGEHPRAADTADGIRQWWLPDTALISVKELETVLDKLIKTGKLSRQVLNDGEIMYSKTNRTGF